MIVGDRLQMLMEDTMQMQIQIQMEEALTVGECPEKREKAGGDQRDYQMEEEREK